MWSFDLASFVIGLFVCVASLILIGLIILLIVYFNTCFNVIMYILEHKSLFEKDYFKISDYNSAKAVFKLLPSYHKDKICDTLDIDSFWECK